MSENLIDFTGRVAVVTGAGNGLGREYAILLASRGAKVVVNDLGGSPQGDGNSLKAADSVVEEIRANGGVAVPNYNSVIDGEKIIQTALDNFGRIDILINNAGILRDRSFARISDQDWDLVTDVHLKGSFKCTRAAWPIFKKQQYGRIIMTSSTSGMYGSFGQANYAAAKMGVIGLARSIAMEGESNGIQCNVIVPLAASRMTEDIMPVEVAKEFKPSLIAPVVAFLCHESNVDNGSIIYSAAGWATKTYFTQNYGTMLRASIKDTVTPENVRNLWDQINDTTVTRVSENFVENTHFIMTRLGELDTVNPNEYTSTFEFNSKDLILYALGVGASVSQESELKFLYENHAEFSPVPSFFVLPGMLLGMNSPMTQDAIKHTTFNLNQILHGEHYLEIVKPCPIDGVLTTKGKVIDVMDKKSGAVVVAESNTFDSDGELLFRSQSSTFIVGAGNFNGNKNPSDQVISAVPVPTRKADSFVQYKTSLDQAALYRLSGDFNPLHIDADFARAGGQPVPILHGLCTLGFSVRAVLQQYAGNNSALFKAVKVRFIKPVIPGQTLRINMWKNGSRIHFETAVVETNTVVINGAYVDLNMVVQSNITSNGAAVQSDAVFQQIKERISADPAKAKSINAVFAYKITKNGQVVKEWTLDLKNASVYEGAPKGVKADTSLTVADADMVDIALGKLNPQAAFMKGKLKITGNIMLTQKLVPFLKTEAKL